MTEMNDKMKKMLPLAVVFATGLLTGAIVTENKPVSAKSEPCAATEKKDEAGAFQSHSFKNNESPNDDRLLSPGPRRPKPIS